MPQSEPQRRMSGVACRYRGKDRNNPLTVNLTPDARRMLDAALAATGQSRADYVEHLIRKDFASMSRRSKATPVEAVAQRP